MPRPIHTGRFRWRLTIAFILVAGISSGAVAVGSFLLVRNHRHEAFTERSLHDARLALTLAESTLGQSFTARDIEQLLTRFKRRSGFETIASTRDRIFVSESSIRLADVQAAAELSSPSPDLQSAEIELDGEPFLVAAASVSDPSVDFHFLISRRPLVAGLSSLAGVLFGAWLVVTLIAALVGFSLARRTLQPVAKASRAARSLAEGLLDTRLPVESEDEFGAWAVSFNQMADALQEKINALSEAHERERRFTSDVSHELRTPLAALVGAASLASQHIDELTPETRWVVERMVDDVARLRNLVEELMEISRLDSGRESIQVETFDLGQLVSQIVSTRDWKSHVELPSLPPAPITTDRRRVERVLANLISNALSHGEKNVRVRVWTDVDFVNARISDDGPGISSEHLSNIFDRFFKADPARTGGSGLGLSIAMENAKLLGGDIEATSKLGSGAKFTLRLPSTRRPMTPGSNQRAESITEVSLPDDHAGADFEPSRQPGV